MATSAPCLVFGADEHQFGHHVVGEQDMRRMLAHGLAVVLAGFAGVTGKGDREGAPKAFLVGFLERLQRLKLRVDQGVHRIDDDRHGAFADGLPQDEIHDGQKVGQAFTGAGAAGDDITLPGTGFFDSLHLMAVEGVGRALRGAKDARCFGMQDAALGEIVYAGAALVGGAELQEEIRPEMGFFIEGALHVGADALIGDVDEGAHEVAVVG